MDNAQNVNRMLETFIWGAIFLWWGITGLLKLPNGMDALGFGLILLGVNAARLLKQIPINNFSTTLGMLALTWGILDLSRSVMHLPLAHGAEFAILLIVLGVILLASALAGFRKTSMQRS